MMYYLKTGIVHKVKYVLFGPSIEVINTDDFMSKVEQLFTEMGAEKPGTASELGFSSYN
jgi:hypothetical protein